MHKKIIPVLAVSGALSLSLMAAPSVALAGEASLTPEQAAHVQKLNHAKYAELLANEDVPADEIDKLLAQLDQILADDAAKADADKALKTAAADDTDAGEPPAPGAATGTEAGTGTQTPGGSDADKPGTEVTPTPGTGSTVKPGTETGKTETTKKDSDKADKADKAKKAAAKKAEKKAKAKADKLAKAKDAAAKKAAAKKQTKAKAADAKRHQEFKGAGSTSIQDTAPSYKRVHYSQSLSTEMFVASIGEQARQVAQKNNLYASVMIAQAILESGSGSSVLSKAPNNNLFGIKGSYKGKSVRMATQEDNGKGSLYTIAADFRKYKTQKQSLADYAKLLTKSQLYTGTWKSNTKNYKEAAQALQGVYATDTQYAEKITELIKTYDLTRFDKKTTFKMAKTEDGQGGKVKPTMNDYANLQALATSTLGTQYVWGGNTRKGFDCSGLVQYLYKNAFGIQLTRTTHTQQHEGTKVDFDELQMGDLLFFTKGKNCYHVAMYLGDGFYIHAPNVGDYVRIESMENFTPNFAKRILNTKER